MEALVGTDGNPLQSIGMGLTEAALKAAGIDIDPKAAYKLVSGLTGLAGKKSWKEMFCGLVDYTKTLPVVGDFVNPAVEASKVVKKGMDLIGVGLPGNDEAACRKTWKFKELKRWQDFKNMVVENVEVYADNGVYMLR